MSNTNYDKVSNKITVELYSSEIREYLNAIRAARVLRGSFTAIMYRMFDLTDLQVSALYNSTEQPMTEMQKAANWLNGGSE